MATDFQSYLESSNERLQEDLMASSYSATNPVSFLEQSRASANAGARYREAMEEQNKRDLGVAIGKAVAVSAGSFWGPVGAYGAGLAYDFAADLLGANDPVETYSKEDYIRSQLAGSIDSSLESVLNGYQFGSRGLTVDQSNQMAGNLFQSMRSQGFQGLELERMMPMLASSGVLDPHGNYSGGTDEAVNDLENKLQNMTEKIGQAVKSASLSIEEATAFVIRENKLAGGMTSVDDTRLMRSMQGVSSATGMSYDESMQFMTSTIGAWGGTSADLIPFTEAAATSVMAGQSAYQSSSRWATSWDRAGGVEQVAGSYAAGGNAYWMEKKNRDRLGRMYASGNLSSEGFYDMAEGGGFDSEASPRITNMNDRYEAEYFGMQAMARNPLAAQSAAYGGIMNDMEDDNIESREAQIVWLNRNKNMSQVQAEAFLEQHNAVSTVAGRNEAYFSSMRSSVSSRRDDVDSAVAQSFHDASVLSGETTEDGTRMIESMYRSGYIEGEDGESGYFLSSDGYLEEIQTMMEEEFVVFEGGDMRFGARHGATNIMNESDRMNLSLFRTTSNKQLSMRGIDIDSTRALNRSIANLSYDDFSLIRVDRNNRGDSNLRHLIAGEMRGSYENSEEAFEAFKELDAEAQNSILNTIEREKGAFFTKDGAVAAAISTGYEEAVLEELSGNVEYVDRLSQIYGGSSTDVAGRSAVASYMSSEEGSAAILRNISNFTGDDFAEAYGNRRELNETMRAISALGDAPETRQYLNTNRGTAEAYQKLTTSLDTNGFNLVAAGEGLNPEQAVDRMEIRDRIVASGGFGNDEDGNPLTWDSIGSENQALVNEWLTVNDPHDYEPPGSGAMDRLLGRETELGQRWGGSNTGAISRARDGLGEQVSASEALKGTQAQQDYIRYSKELVGTDQFNAITWEDQVAYTAAVSAGGDALDEFRATVSDEQFSQLGVFGVRTRGLSGQLGLSDADANVATMSDEIQSVLFGLAEESGVVDTELDNFIVAMMNSDKTALGNMGIEEGNAVYDFIQDKDMEIDELVGNVDGVSFSESTQAGIDNERQIGQVRDYYEQGITTVGLAENQTIGITAAEPIPVTFLTPPVVDST